MYPPLATSAGGGGSYRQLAAAGNGVAHQRDEYEPASSRHLPEHEYDDHVSHDRFSSWPDSELSREEQFPLSASREGSVPLSHPTPDLQSLQGAYVGNVVRLEESAERLSLGSDIGEEVRKLHMEQKRSESQRSSVRARQFSSNSKTNSILGLNNVARSGGFSHEGYVTSPTSMRSPSWSFTGPQERLHQLDQYNEISEPSQEGKPLDSRISTRPSVRRVNRQNYPLSPKEEESNNSFSMEATGRDADQGEGSPRDPPHRSASVASGDTFLKASNAFADFDGVHIRAEEGSPEPGEPMERRMSVSPSYSAESAGLPLGSEPGPGSNMVYYPAPVPAMLNLPAKLSKRPPASKIEQRRTQLLSAVPKVEDEESLDQEGSTRLPPQLRATMYFEHPSIKQDLEIQSGSAVATLESLLDAAADAPVSAFTDHPILGQVGAGAEVYGKAQDHRRSSANLLKNVQNPQDNSRRSFLGFGGKTKKRMTSTGGLSTHDLVEDHNGNDDGDEKASLHQSVDDEKADGGYDQEEDDLEDSNRPTTLLAELQMRKQQQQKRNRTAATAFPDGMRSTLLQLDAVAQVERKSRNQKHVTLAWENPGGVEVQDNSNDEVPLGMLYPGKNPKINDAGGRFDEDKPLGLLAQRAMEDNEPLSARRARLRGEPPPSMVDDRQERNTSMFNLQVPGVTTDAASEDEGEETLAERMQRLRNKDTARASRRISADFSSELLSQFGALKDEEAPVEHSKTPDPEETLGQRRKRLQAEKLRAEEASGAHKTKSMADLLHAHPVGDQSSARQPAPARGLIAASTWQTSRSVTKQPYPTPRQKSFGPGYVSTSARAPEPHEVVGPHPRTGQYVNPMAYSPMLALNGQNGVTPALARMGPIGDHLPLDPDHRAMIDRWRQSVL